MVANRTVRKRREVLTGLAGRIKRPLVLLVGFGFVCGAASNARAQCGVGGDFTGQCIDLTLAASVSSVQVGEVFEVEFLAKSVNGFEQPVFGIEGIVFWDPSLIRLLGSDFDCQADDTATPCYTCGQTVAGGLTGYNWVMAGFPNDSGLDGVNADCGPDTFCAIYTGLPFNDGTLFFQAIKQFFCNGQQAPAAMAPVIDPLMGSLLVGRLAFEALAPGTVQITLERRAPCATHQRTCKRGTVVPLGGPCATDADCGIRACFGGSNGGMCSGSICVGGPNEGAPCSGTVDCGAPCSSDTECPGGVCPTLCLACSGDFCCTGEDNCAECAFSESRVLSGVASSPDVTNLLVSAAPISITDCPVPSVSVDSSRYLNVVPPAGANPVAIEVLGVSQNVSCVSKFVQSNGLLADTPVYKTPAEWQSSMTDALNDPTDPTVHVRGNELVAGETYSARLDCNALSPGTSVSAGAQGTLWIFGDTDDNGDRNITDVVRILSGFSGVFHTLNCASHADCVVVDPFFYCDPDQGQCLWLTLENVDIIGVGVCGSDRDISIIDALSSLQAFQGLPNPCTILCP